MLLMLFYSPLIFGQLFYEYVCTIIYVYIYKFPLLPVFHYLVITDDSKFPLFLLYPKEGYKFLCAYNDTLFRR